MKWMRAFMLFFFSGLIAFGAYLYFYLGLNKDVTFAVESRGPFWVAYLNHSGAYHTIGDSIQEVEEWAKGRDLRCKPAFGEFLDDPNAMDPDRLRSRGGCFLENSVPVNPNSSVRVEQWPERTYLVARFQGAPAAGPMRVYPAASKYIVDQRLVVAEAVIEIYLSDSSQTLTEFLWVIKNP